jgi:hypothetical protein
MRRIVSLLIILSCASVSASAQPVGAGSGPLSEISRPLRDGSGSVHDGRSVRDGSVGSMISGPVRGERRVGMLSGPVSDISVGPVTSGRPMTGGGSMSENSAGAVKQELDPSFGEQVYDLQRTLGPLQEQLRLQAEADAAAALDAAPQEELEARGAERAADLEREAETVEQTAEAPLADPTEGNAVDSDPLEAHDAASEPTPTD